MAFAVEIPDKWGDLRPSDRGKDSAVAIDIGCKFDVKRAFPAMGIDDLDKGFEVIESIGQVGVELSARTFHDVRFDA